MYNSSNTIEGSAASESMNSQIENMMTLARLQSNVT